MTFESPLLYILAQDGRTPIATQDEMLWAMFRTDFERSVVAKSRDEEKDITVSTVFLGMDHGYGDGQPVLFETLVFGGQFDERMVRYCTWEEAEKGHKLMCARVGISIPWNTRDVG